MARRRKAKGRPVNGWIVLDKPAGMGSTDCVSAVKRLFFAQKAGHAGTLDPLATGMLPIALGDATKTVPFLVDGDKIYRFTVRWGAQMATDDSDGELTRESDTRPTKDDVLAALSAYIGEIQQVPPAYSAIKIDGNRAYDLAREGETVEIPARPVVIDRLEVVDTPDADSTVFEIQCGPGTYVRSIARDLGRDLGCYGHVTALRRVMVGGFDEADMVPLDELRSVADESREELDEESIEAGAKPRILDYSALDAYVIAPEAALSDLDEVMLSDDQAGRVLSGNAVLLRGRDAPVASEGAFAIGHGRLIALGSIAQGAFQPRRVFGGKGA